MTAILDLAQEWLRLDKDPTTRAEMQELLNRNDQVELESRLRKRIAFGTAGKLGSVTWHYGPDFCSHQGGLRARMGAGFSRMNSLTVIQTSQGLAAYLLKTVPSAASKGVVIGFDARHNSRRFARLAAAAFIAKGIKVWWYELLAHTPLVPYGVKELHAAAGVMVTASHNPAQDNGYKVYWSNGCQIIPPHDGNIATSILSNLEPLSWDDMLVYDKLKPPVTDVYDRVRNSYFAAVARAIKFNTPRDAEGIPFMYTPMHGVGLPYMTQVMDILGVLKDMTVVQEQARPDPDFPTVKFPNPEEKGALDRACRAADRSDISLVIATDPDADRLAVAEKLECGRWHQFTGNQLGVLLASRFISNPQTKGYLKSMAMLNTTVSTGMLRAMAEKEGFAFEETLTGFKWLGNKALELEAKGVQVKLAFEEAIGYMIPSIVHDKDGISAAALFVVSMWQWWVFDQVTPWEKLQQLYRTYGYFETANTYLLSPDPTTTERVFARIRQLGDPYPQCLGSRKIQRWRDITLGWDSGTDTHAPVLPVTPDSQMITCELEDQVRLTMRSSGTEPKIKVYVECQGESATVARAGANQVLSDLLREWLQPQENGLKQA
ncbi:MAG: Phosphoglucomutase-3 [Peltula sp. TS41687]|nr:MAG: Phosphoglucomutase-3 [Peltula sp. TS41687]